MQRFSIFHDAGDETLRNWHLPYARTLANFGPVLDVGCGLGVFLDLLREQNTEGVGLDIDPEMVKATEARGHKAVVGDHKEIRQFSNLGAIHVSHVIEHMWGDDVVESMELSFKALMPGGLLVIRTPNWRCDVVRHVGFWMDHTHRRPYPPELLRKLATDLGFAVHDSGYEPFGWEDVYFICYKPGGTEQLPAKLTWRWRATSIRSLASRMKRRLLG